MPSSRGAAMRSTVVLLLPALLPAAVATLLSAGTCHEPAMVPNASFMCAGAVNYSFLVPAGFSTGALSCRAFLVSARLRSLFRSRDGVSRD